MAACQPGPTPTPIRPGGTGQPNATTGPGATSAGPVTPGEANVITGRVTTEPGQPIAGAQVRIVGYTGGANLGMEFGTFTTDADGVYRVEVPAGQYEVLAQGVLPFDGQDYLFELDPSDGQCDQEMSNVGIVEDFTLHLTGLIACRDYDPDDHVAYHGAVVQLNSQMSVTRAPHEVIEYTLQPIGALADGSPGETLVMTRTVGAFQTSAGPIDSTWVLYDIPLARYSASAALVDAGGARVPLLVSTDTTTTPAAEVELVFDARVVFDVPTAGYSIPQLRVHDEVGG